jgi:uncharacterized caspase-like protein
MKKYLIEVLGFLPQNIIEYENATLSNFCACFGSATNPKGLLASRVKPGQSDVFVYYSGHGAPDEKARGYFVPVDADISALPQTGYNLELFYENLGQITTKSLTIVIDACFSGAEYYRSIPRERRITTPPGALVITASDYDQFSTHFPIKKMGIFTYFVLKAIHDSEHSDANHDKTLTWGEVYDYISSPTDGVPYYAGRIKVGTTQTPRMAGDRNRVLCVLK